MQNLYFVYAEHHKYYGGWIRVIAVDWKTAMAEYEFYFGRDFLNFYEESLFNKEKYPKGEIQII